MRAEDGSVSFAGDMPAFDDSQFVPVEVKAGSLVVLHGANVHFRWVGGAFGRQWGKEWLQKQQGRSSRSA